MNTGLTEQIYQNALRLHNAGDTAVARETCHRLLRIDPRHAGALRLLGVLAYEEQELETATRLMKRAADSAPGVIDHRFQLADWLADADRFEDALSEYRAVLAADPHCVAAWFNCGRTLQDIERYDEALDCYLKAVEFEPRFRDAALNLGIVLRHLGRFEEAVAVFSQLIDGDTEDSQSHLQRSLTHLAAGQLAAGWDEYDWRWRAEAEPRTWSQPTWDGAALSGERLLLSAEQGIGDQVQFASCVADALERVNHCLLECEPRLAPLFRRSFPDADVVAAPYAQSHCDCQLPIGDLPRLFRRSFTAFSQSAWLVADSNRVAFWKQRFSALGADRVIGISWSGGKKPEVRRSRSTSLEQWLPVLSARDTAYVTLQYGAASEEWSSFAQAHNVPIFDWPDVDPLKDLDDLAAQIAALDLVISVDNSTVHLAGALGTPVWTLLPFASDYRWLRDTDCSPWYRSMRLFRQPRPGEWGAVFESVAVALQTR